MESSFERSMELRPCHHSSPSARSRGIEYGLPTSESAADEDVIISLLEIADSRFQDGLLKKASAP